MRLLIELATVSLAHVVLVVFALDSQQFYAISNKGDRTYLKWINNGKFCKSFGDVISTRNVVWEQPEYSWYYQATGSAGHAHILAHGNGYINNKLTNENGPPFCNPNFADYKFHKVRQIYYRIAKLKTNKCLTGNGDGRKISFEDCNDRSEMQLWFFSEMAGGTKKLD